MRECRRYIVHGRVQGVCYRMSTQQAAYQFGISGWVRNLTNGDVEAVACGNLDALERFERWLWNGPDLASVESVSVSTVDDEGVNDFSIR